MKKDDTFDVIVIGSGPGGCAAAIHAVGLGMRTLLVEMDRIGGAYLNRGAVPSRALLESARVLERIRNSSDYGLDCGSSLPDWQAMTKRAKTIAAKLSKYAELQLRRKRVIVVNGIASLLEPTRIKVTSAKEDGYFSAGNIIIATGASPVPLPGVEFEAERFVSFRDLLGLPEIPKQILVVGGDVIGVECAYLFSEMGSQVYLFEEHDSFLSCLQGSKKSRQ